MASRMATGLWAGTRRPRHLRSLATSARPRPVRGEDAARRPRRRRRRDPPHGGTRRLRDRAATAASATNQSASVELSTEPWAAPHGRRAPRRRSLPDQSSPSSPYPDRQMCRARPDPNFRCWGLSRRSSRRSDPSLLPSRPGEFHPEPLTEPDVILSHHPAHAIARRLPPSAEQEGSSRHNRLAQVQRR